MTYEVGRVYVWQNQVGEFAHLNGTECTVTAPGVVIDGVMQWATDAPAPNPCYVVVAYMGDLRPRDTPSGERSIMELFEMVPA
jgi:hypothetical protein